MSCGACRKRLSELAGDELDGKTATEVHAHLESCPSCAQAYRETVAVVGLLRRAGEARLPEGFGPSLHRRLVAAGTPPRPGLLSSVRSLLAPRPLYWALAGVAAAAALAVFGARLRGTSSTGGAPAGEIAEGPVAPIYRVPASRLAVVKIDFVAEQPVADVAFAVALPEGLRFVSGGRELPDREFSWRGPLAEGSNPVPFAVRGSHAGRYRIKARATGSGVDASHDVVLEVTKG